MANKREPVHGGNRERAMETAVVANTTISINERITNLGQNQGQIEAILPRGAENAIPSKTLAALLGYRSVRQLQTAVHAERNAGAVILTKTDSGGGYYRPALNEKGRAEINRFIRTLDSRARRTQLALRSARTALRECDAQIKMEGAE